MALTRRRTSAVRGAAARVLIGFGNSLAAPEVAWSLVDAGFDVVAFIRRGDRAGLRHSRLLRLVEITAPEADAARATAELAAAAKGFDVLMPLDDAAVWLCNECAGDGSVRIAGPDGRRVDAALDKRVQLAAAQGAGFNVPPTDPLHPTEPEVARPYPLVLKPALAIVHAEGRLSRPSPRACANHAELEAAVAQATGPLLVQPLVVGAGEGLFGVMGPDGPSALSAHRRIRMMNPQGSGSSACESRLVDDGLVGPARRMLESLEWRGLFMIELLRDERGTPWFIELNGRPWGSIALARRLGLEYPAWAAWRALDPDFAIDGPEPREGVVCRHVGREIVHLLMVVRGPRSAAFRGQWPSRTRTALELLRIRRGDCWYNWRRDDARVFVADAYATVRDQLRSHR